MNEFFKRLLDQIKGLWAKWNTTQKIILFSILGAAILAVVLLIAFSAAPSMTPVIATPVTDENARLKIAGKLEELNVKYEVRSDNIFYVSDEKTARRVRMILSEEDLIPMGTDPWAIFDMERWTTTDFERNVNLQRAITQQLTQHIESLADIDNASVTLVVPQKELFTEDQKPVSASVILWPKPGANIKENRKQIEGIQRLILKAVEGLKEENLVITDQSGYVLNDFTGLEDIDRLTLAERELKIKQQLEAKYQAQIYNSLKMIFTPDRVVVLKNEINLDMSKISSTAEEFSPIAVKPAGRFTEAEYAPSIARSTQTTEEHFKGTNFNPEGPPGQEGQTPPAYQDLLNGYGTYDKSQQTTNNEINKKVTSTEQDPYEIKRITIGVALDGIWKELYDTKGQVQLNPDGSIKREYTPVSDADLAKAKSLIQAAIGYDRVRGDNVDVQTLAFDRTNQFEKEDSVYRRQISLRRTLFYVLAAVGGILVLAFVYRLVAKERERRRRLREEELARQHQAMREAALRSAEEQGVEVELSVEDRARLEMQENAVNMAREHPEDVAQLIRTWLVEE